MKSPITPNILMDLTALFQRKNWELADGTVADMGLFDKFCERLRLFTTEEQEMIIEISEDFIRIGMQEYLVKFFDSFFLLGDSFFDGHEKVYVLPLVDPYVSNRSKGTKVFRGKAKSADFLHYLFDASEWRWFSNKLIPNITVKKLFKLFNPKDSCLVLIDDFVGTGQTAVDVCTIFLQENFDLGSLSPEKIKVVSIAAQERGITYVRRELGIEVSSNIIVPRGISDKFVVPELPIKVAHMQAIESKLAITPAYNFGFEQSEAMITFLNKTPNNTFPVYWHETRAKVAPFPRYKNYRA